MVIGNKMIAFAIIVMLFGGILLVGGSMSPAGFTDGEVQGKHAHYGKLELTKTKYATSWESEGTSEMITAQPYWKITAGISFHSMEKYLLVAYIGGQMYKTYPTNADIEDHDTWADDPYGWVIKDEDEWNPLSSWSFEITGTYVGKLKIQMYAFMHGTWPYPDWEGEFGWDGADLYSGKGEIFLYGSTGPFEEGSTAKVYVSTGFTNGAGWTVKLRPPITRPELFSVKSIDTLGDDVAKLVEIPIEYGWFIEGEREDNQFRVELWNNLFEVGFETIFAVDNLDYAPSIPIISWEIVDRNAEITVTSTAVYQNIEGFVVWAWYGSMTMPSEDDSQDWIIHEREYPASQLDTDNYTARFTLSPKNFDGSVVLRVSSYDTSGRSSGYAVESFKVENGSFGKGDAFSQPFIWGMLVYLVIALGIIIGLIAGYWVYLTKGISYALIVFFIILGIFGGIAFYIGITPSLALIGGI